MFGLPPRQGSLQTRKSCLSVASHRQSTDWMAHVAKSANVTAFDHTQETLNPWVAPKMSGVCSEHFVSELWVRHASLSATRQRASRNGESNPAHAGMPQVSVLG